MKSLLKSGDVIRTNPFPGYWGIAIVLSEQGKTSEFDPMCHIALTPLIFQHAIDMSELRIEDLSVLEIEGWNADPFGTNTEAKKVIGVYSRYVGEAISVIGTINPKTLYDGPLPFSPDYGLESATIWCARARLRAWIFTIMPWRNALPTSGSAVIQLARFSSRFASASCL